MKALVNSLALSASLLACTPRLHGLCSGDAQCAADEICSAEGLCIVRVNAVRIDTPDDSGGAGWYRGATASPPTADLEISAALPESFRARTWAYYAGSSRSVEGHEAGGRWHYVLPRADAPTTIVIESSDTNGVRAPSATLPVKFDSITAFAPTIAADTRWYAGRADGALTIPISFATLPASGLAGVRLDAGATRLSAAQSADPQHWTVALPLSLAQANTEAAIPFTVTATSVTGLSTTATGARNFDTKPPAIASVNVFYPAPQTTPMSWSTDGSHFRVRDAGPLVAVTVYDCGAGLRQALRSSLPEVPGLTADFAPTGQTVACPSPLPPAKSYTLTLSGDLTRVASGAFGIDSVLRLTAQFDDDARAFDGSATITNRATLAQDVNVTRRLWTSQLPGSTMLALAPGPTVVSAGSQGLWMASASAAPAQKATLPIPRRPVVATNNGDPRIFYVSGDYLHALPLAGPEVTCRLATGVASHDALVLRDASTAIAMFQYDCRLCTNAYVAQARAVPLSALSSTNPSCGVATTIASGATAAGVGRNNRLFWTDGSNLLQSDVTTDVSAPTSTPLASGAGLSLTDDAGNDAILVETPSSASRTSAAMSALTPLPGLAARAVTVALGPSHTLVGTSANAATDLAQLELAAGPRPGAAANVAGAPLVAVDASRPRAIAYVAHAGNASSVATFFVDPVAGLSPGPLPPIVLPAAVDDLVLGADGVLYVLGGGVVYAYQTDSPGLGTAAGAPNGLAWPIDQRDACRSSNLAYACPN